MDTPAIPLAQARRVARTGNIDLVRLMGQEHNKRQALWEPLSLARIIKRHGHDGLLAALGARDARQAANRILSTSPLDWYLGRGGLQVWMHPGMEETWSALCEAPDGFFHRSPLSQKQAWDEAMRLPVVSTETARLTARSLDRGALDPLSLLWPASNRHADAMEAWKEALGIGYLAACAGQPVTAGTFKIPASPVYHLIANAKLLARGRLGRLLDEMERDALIMQSLQAQRGTLCFAAMQSGRVGLVRRILGWGEDPPVLDCGTDLLRASILCDNLSTGPFDARWPCMLAMGVAAPGRMLAQMNDPTVVDALLHMVREGGSAIHATHVLVRASEVGVDITHLRDRQGVPLIDAIRARQTAYSDEVLARIQHAQLGKSTTPMESHSRRPRL